jgi:osmotically-inducible protein OsmY
MKTASEIQKDVLDELNWDSILKESEIGVSVKNNIVTLFGTVDSYSKKIAAENAAMRIIGVKAVANELEVTLPGLFERTDTEIAETILNNFKWRSQVPDDCIKVKVEKGWVTLEGSVDWEFQKKSAKEVVEGLVGVRGVTNLICVTSKNPIPGEEEIKEKIMAAYYRHASFDARRIDIDIEGSKVILKGEVRSLAEKIDVENAAWSAPGVNAVENKLMVDYSGIFA